MKNPAILFYTGDFITGTLFLTNEEVGAYIRALCMQHQKGHLEENDLMQICKKKSIFDTILLYFKKDKKGLYYNKRMDLEKEKRQKYSESRAKNRSKSKKDMKIISNTYEEHMENENENENENIYNNINNKYILNLYSKVINNNISSIELEKLNYYLNVFKEDLRIVEYAIEYCKMYKAYNINYLCKILNNWEKNNFKTLEEIKEKEKVKKEERENVELFEYDWLNEE